MLVSDIILKHLLNPSQELQVPNQIWIGNFTDDVLLYIKDFVNNSIFDEKLKLYLALKAAKKGYEGCLLLLQESGYNLKATNTFAKNRDEEYLALLVDYDGTKYGRTLGFNLANLKMGIISTFECTPVYQAAANGHDGCLRLLKEAGCDLCLTNDWNRETLAHIAADNGHVNCLRLLQDAGCNLGQASHFGWTIAHSAALHGHEGCLRFLKDEGCDLGQKDDEGQTPAICATYEICYEGCLRVLHEAGCDLDEPDNEGNTPAHFAARNSDEKCLKLLKEFGCDLGKAKNDGKTPAHLAVWSVPNERIVRFLHQAGCDLGKKDEYGNTPAHYAADAVSIFNMKEKCLRFLQEAGYDLHLKNKEGKTPADLALKNNDGCYDSFWLFLQDVKDVPEQLRKRQKV